jgi:hypothetical protein
LLILVVSQINAEDEIQNSSNENTRPIIGKY